MKDMDETSGHLKSQKCSYLPRDWETFPLAEVCEHPVSGYSPTGSEHPAGENGVGVLKLSCIKENRFCPSQNKSVLDTKAADLMTPVKRDTLIISRSNTNELVGSVCYIEHDYPNLFLSDLLWQVSAKSRKKVDLKWLAYLLSFGPYRAKIKSLANGTSGSMKKLTKSGFLGIHIVCPQLKEQTKIAEILSTWDTAIDQTRKLIAAKKNRKKALMQQLFVGRNSWEEMTLSQAFKRIQRVGSGNKDIENVLSITATVGFVHQNDKFSRVIAGTSIERYILLKKGEFAYNKGSSKSYPQGCIYMLEEYDQGVVPNVYFCFTPRYNGIYGMFFKYYFENGALNDQLHRVINTGVRNDGLLNLNPSDFFGLKILVPPIKEQRYIATLFSTADQEIQALQKDSTALERQKQGLMQKLLTGEVRVKV